MPCPCVPVSRVLPQGTALLQCGVTARVTPLSQEKEGTGMAGTGGALGRGQRAQGLCVGVCVSVCAHVCVNEHG